MKRAIPILLYFGSGFSGLVYEVVWMRELGLLFGNTAQAAAITLAVFFFGLAAGNAFWGWRASRMRRPLWAFGFLEAGIALSALGCFGLIRLYSFLYPHLYALFGHAPLLLLFVKIFLSILVLLPPTFLMGGTFPTMGQHFVSSARDLGKSASLLYAVNTLGAACGAYLAGFRFPLLVGFKGAFAIAAGGNLVVALVAWSTASAWDPAAPDETSPIAEPERAPTATGRMSNPLVVLIAALSGFLTLALEVLWIRMFAQVLQNSVYTYSGILVVFLFSLTLGGALASYLVRLRWEPRLVLALLAAFAGVLVALSPPLFHRVTGGMNYLGGNHGWSGYVLEVFGALATVVMLPCLFAGTLFPYLFKVAGAVAKPIGSAIGELAGWNTLGAILGSLAAGFAMIQVLGLWMSLWLVATLYFILSFALSMRLERGRNLARAAQLLGCAVLILVLGGPQLPGVFVFDKRQRLLEVWEAGAGTVAVTEAADLRFILFNNHYVVGGQTGKEFQELMGNLPLLLSRNPKEAFVLGMGTGITAGAMLDHPLEHLLVCELVPEIILASRKYFRSDINGLFEDPRATVLAEDGRHYLAAVDSRYDVILGDLFVPWKKGAGSLYTVEHFETVFGRVRENGLFAQWMPLYQLTREEFGIVANTLLRIFPRVTLWRGDFIAHQTVVALVGHRNREPLDPQVLERNLANPALKRDRSVPPGVGPLLSHYLGDLSSIADLFEDLPANTDDRPVIEFLAPLAEREQAAGRIGFFTGEEMIRFYGELMERNPPETDPFLAKFTPEQVAWVRKGLDIHKSSVSAPVPRRP
jgi:spermidine synthase